MSVSNRTMRLVLLLLVGACIALPAWAQDTPKTAVISIYRIAPGKHLDFMKWMAAREAVAREAGVPATQWYAHIDGDSWDYLAIGPDTDGATSDKIDAMQRKRGLKSGPAGSIELRTMMASHTDTISAGPMTAAQMIEAVTAP